MKMSYTNNETSRRIQRWLCFDENDREMTQRMKSNSKKESAISNNATRMTEVKELNISKSIQNQLIRHLNGWSCLQQLYRRSYDYITAINLSKVVRSILSNSQQILILSIWIPPSFSQKSTNHVRNYPNTSRLNIFFDSRSS